MYLIQDLFQFRMKRLLADDRIKSDAGADAENTAFLFSPANQSEIDSRYRNSGLLSCDCFKELMHSDLWFLGNPKSSAEIISRSARNHTEANFLKIGNSV